MSEDHYKIEVLYKGSEATSDCYQKEYSNKLFNLKFIICNELYYLF